MLLEINQILSPVFDTELNAHQYRCEACRAMKQADVEGLIMHVQYLIPAIGPVRGVDEQGDDLSLRQQGSSSSWGLL